MNVGMNEKQGRVKYIHPYILVTVDTKRRLYADVLWTFVCMCLVAHKTTRLIIITLTYFQYLGR